jgi:hypothetical protein
MRKLMCPTIQRLFIWIPWFGGVHGLFELWLSSSSSKTLLNLCALSAVLPGISECHLFWTPMASDVRDCMLVFDLNFWLAVAIKNLQLCVRSRQGFLGIVCLFVLLELNFLGRFLAHKIWLEGKKLLHNEVNLLSFEILNMQRYF